MIFLAWLLVAFLVVGVINIYLRFFGRPKLRGAGGDTGGVRGFLGGAVGFPGAGESCQWINSVLSWLFLHYDHTPEFVDVWLRSLNEQARKHSGDVQVKFDRIQAGSLPPKFTKVHTEVGPRDSLTVHANVEASDMTFLVSTLQQTGTNIKVSNCDVVLQNLQGQLKVFSHYHNDQIDINATFTAPPELKVQVKPRSTENNPNITPKDLEKVLRNALGSSSTAFSISPKGLIVTPIKPDQTGMVAQSAMPVGATRPATLRDRRLLVKVIKANGLGEKDFGARDPYCIVQMDYPQQKHSTSVVKNTVNPFWDEHFLFDLEDTTQKVTFEVFDREKPPGDDFLGRAVISMTDLRRMPSSRQIIPLQGRTGATQASSSASITIEFLFMEPAEAHQLQTTGRLDDGSTPRRRIETNRQVTPGGTVVTTTTTTTEKPRDSRLDASFNAPIPIESRPFGSPTVTVTHAASGEIPQGATLATGASAVPESITTEDGRETRSLSTASAGSPEPTKEMKKSKSFASAIRKRFGRPKKPRSHSADRAGSLRDDRHLLKPPEHRGTKTTAETSKESDKKKKDDLDQAEIPQGTLRKSRSHSFSSSLKRIFRKKKKGEFPSSRESSISRGSQRGYDVSREGSTAQASPQLSPRDSSLQPSPDITRGDTTRMYSSSVPPAPSPLYDQYAH